LIFGLFRETKKILFRFVSVFLTRFKLTETTETNRSVLKQTEKKRKKQHKNKTKNFGSNRNKLKLVSFSCFSVCFAKPKKMSVPFNSVFRFRIETAERPKTNRSVSKQIEKTNKTRGGGRI
jgi:hypothetical protein